jgi:pilus assembly protein CpaE
MNAPWKPGPLGNRDPFAAFICDEAALDVLRPVIIEMGWQPEKCNKGGLRNAVQSLSISASPAILMVDLSESGDPLNDINGLAEVCEPGTVVIAVGQVNDVRLYRDLVASGIQDYLLKPLSASQLRDTLTQAQAVFASPRNSDGEAVKKHVSTAVVGTRGGVGASTLATSFAWLFSADHKRPTAMLDLDVHFGTGALSLDLEPGRGPDRRHREPEPHRRTVHRARDDQGERASRHPLGRGPDQLAADDRWFGIPAARGRIPSGV